MPGTDSPTHSAFEKNPERFVRGLPQPPVLPEQVWINKPKETALRNSSEAMGVPNSIVDSFGRKNGFHNCAISNERESGRDLPNGEKSAER